MDRKLFKNKKGNSSPRSSWLSSISFAHNVRLGPLRMLSGLKWNGRGQEVWNNKTVSLVVGGDLRVVLWGALKVCVAGFHHQSTSTASVLRTGFGEVHSRAGVPSTAPARPAGSVGGVERCRDVFVFWVRLCALHKSQWVLVEYRLCNSGNLNSKDIKYV